MLKLFVAMLLAWGVTGGGRQVVLKRSVWPSPTPAIVWAKPTPTKAPKPTPAVHRPAIRKVEVFDGTSGESTFGYVTGVKVTGKYIGDEARMKLTKGEATFEGMYQGGDGRTWLLTDFLGLPHCQIYNVVVNGPNGQAV